MYLIINWNSFRSNNGIWSPIKFSAPSSSQALSLGGAGETPTTTVNAHNLLAERKSKLFRRLPLQAYALQGKTAEDDLKSLRDKVDFLDKKLQEQRSAIETKYDNMMQNKKRFREASEGILYTPTKEMEYVQNVFRRFARTMPANSTTRPLLPVMCKFFNVDPSTIWKINHRRFSTRVFSVLYGHIQSLFYLFVTLLHLIHFIELISFAQKVDW